MKKFWMILFIALVLSVGISGKADTVQAKDVKHLKTSESVAEAKIVRSRGNMIYRESRGETKLCAEDFLFLWDKLSTIPENTFDPVCYTHTHKWEYQDINEKTHTRHCDSCGGAYDLTSVHIVSREEHHPITCDGKVYSGRRYTCICGYQWVREAAHELIFEAVNETNHRIRCALQDTGFCQGFEPVEEEHYAYVYVPCPDGAHHKIICMDCGYTAGEEDCSFIRMSNPDEEDDRDPDLLYCECGNGQKASAETEAETADNAENPSDTVDKTEESLAENEDPEESPVSSDTSEESPSGDDVAEEKPAPADTVEENPTGDEEAENNPPSSGTPEMASIEGEETTKNPALSGTPEESASGTKDLKELEDAGRQAASEE